jgi:hypothetical protein
LPMANISVGWPLMPHFLGYGLTATYTQRISGLVAYLAHGHF